MTQLGDGNSFLGGTICGFVGGKNIKGALGFGVAASKLKNKTLLWQTHNKSAFYYKKYI